MEYQFTRYDEIEAYNAPIGSKGTLRLHELARSVLLSREDTTNGLQASDIAQLIAAKNTYLKAGVKERWEKTLRDVLRTYYCFIPHSLHRQRDHFYTCDPGVDPSLKRQSGFKRAWGSETPGPSSVATSTGTGSMSPFLPNLINRDLTEKMDEPITAFELEVSEVYEQQADARSGGVLYCQPCGPVLLQRQRWDGRIRTRKFAKLVRLLRGSTIAGQSLKELFKLQSTAGWPSTISRDLAKEIAENAKLPLPADSILSDLYPDLPNDSPPFVIRRRRLRECRYCGARMSRLELSKHHALLQGTCQLEHPQKMTRYIPLLNEPLDDLPQNSKEDESEEEGLAEKFARPIIQPAFTSWSQEETEAFFHGLVRCSRFRPDAISEHIQTKSEAEVMALIDTLEEQSSLIKAQDIAPAETEPVPAAREMSDAWIAMEEQLAEDVVVWEAFVEQACRTPPSLRDSAQKAALRKYYNVSCLQCRAGVCDKEGPLCIGLSRATTSGLPNLTLTKDQAPELSRAIAAAYPDYGKPISSGRALREEFLQGMTWLHLVALPGSGQETKASLKSRLELLWWKAESGISTEQDVDTAHETDADIGLSSNNHNFFLRRHVARAFRGSSKGSSPLLEDKEAIFQYLKQTYASSTQTLPSLSDVRSMAALSDVLKIKSDLEKTYEYELKSAAKRVKRAFASDGRNWTEIPLSHVPSETWREHPEDAGIFEELQQAREQLRAVRLKAIDLGEAGSLFNLRNLGLLLDLYRRDSDVVAAISKQVIDDLYQLVRKHTSRVLAIALNIADSRGVTYLMGQSDQADSFKKCVEEAAVVLRSQINHKNEATTLKKLLGGLNIPRALTSEHTGETGWKMSKAFDIEPLNPYSLDNWDEDLACSNTKQSQESEGDEQDRWDETEESELSEFEDDEDIENYASERAIDTKLTEDDKIEDLIYEEKLWELINGKNVMINPELDEKEKIAENSENEAGFSNAENQDDDDDDDEEENILALDLQESSSDDESEQSIDEDIQDNLQADKTRLKDGGSPARQSNTTSRDEGEDEEGYDEEHEGPRKRQRTSQSGRTPWARRSDTDEERSRKKKRSKSEKTRYRTQEFISTSDEEDE